MFDKLFIKQAITRSTSNGMERRRFMQAVGLTGLTAGAALTSAGPAQAQLPDDIEIPPAAGYLTNLTAPLTDLAVLNFALNLEYLEAEFYQRAVYGRSLPDNLIGGIGGTGPVTGGRPVPFESRAVRLYAEEIADDERNHVEYLRGALGNAAVGRPAIDIDASFTAAARAAGLVGPDQTFDVYANERNFLLGAYVFEDVGVTAYKGASPLVGNKDFLDAAAGILAVEAYHAGIIRTNLYNMGLIQEANAISDARDRLDGSLDKDQGITNPNGSANLVPTDPQGKAFGRTPFQVLNIVYLNPDSVDRGGFLPAGANGLFRNSL